MTDLDLRKVGFERGLRFAASILRQSGHRDLAIKITEVVYSNLTSHLANMDEIDAQVVYAAAVADCAPAPAPIKRKPTLVLVSNNKPADAWGWAGP